MDRKPVKGPEQQHNAKDITLGLQTALGVSIARAERLLEHVRGVHPKAEPVLGEAPNSLLDNLTVAHGGALHLNQLLAELEHVLGVDQHKESEAVQRRG